MKQTALFSRNQYEPCYPEAPGWKGGQTSRDAAPEVSDASALRARVMAALREHGGQTADELARRLGADKLAVRPRVSELHQLGRISDSGQRAHNASGKSAIIWALAPRD